MSISDTLNVGDFVQVTTGIFDNLVFTSFSP